MKGFIFVLDEENVPHFINVNSIVTINGTNKGRNAELHLSNCSMFTAKKTVEEVAKLIEASLED
ncbi:hypothetical protein NYQ10_15455 [Flavobacterium johnsoniae]|uniref:Uncharacterized protein n=3 Tax=Flavobacterium TaxID=237 RepID=A0A1M5VWK0_FLAJO|nr:MULTISPECIES: hypothetical protein [Flavobacterium]PTT19235.1 hypothetical protein DBR27_00035 [Flavobacterium sp. HMWF030]WJS93487.1 hypothetical protein NYQ10_15455 [Flavobacterium johnsoniae]SHG36755.1 hypothetical protein SAMN05443663_102638 [Flavobacterium defluvii]SHH79323.1 hypothetical protein SAMN05444388_12033 [Flavobacterium johnsoniae]